MEEEEEEEEEEEMKLGMLDDGGISRLTLRLVREFLFQITSVSTH